MIKDQRPPLSIEDEFLMEFYAGTFRTDLVKQMDAPSFQQVILSMKRRIDSLEKSRDAWRSLAEGE